MWKKEEEMTMTSVLDLHPGLTSETKTIWRICPDPDGLLTQALCARRRHLLSQLLPTLAISLAASLPFSSQLVAASSGPSPDFQGQNI